MGFNPSITIGIHTLGRNFQQAPNSLVLAAKPLSFQPGKSRPEKLHLVDNSREVQLQAAEHSRDFAHRKADGPGEAYLDNGSPVKGASASGGYWQESVFKMRLIRKDKWGREVRVTIPNIFNSNVGEIIGDTINVSLEGRDGLDRLYRPGGPF